MRTMRSLLVGSDLILTAHSAPAPDDDEWDEYVELLREVVSKRASFRNIVFADGSGPNAGQRARATEASQGKEAPVAVVSSSAMVRGVVVALRWIARVDIRSYAPDEAEDAFAHLRLSETERRDVIAALHEIQAEIGRLDSASGVAPFRRAAKG